MVFLEGLEEEGGVATMVVELVIQEGEEEDHQVCLDLEVVEEMMDLFLEEINFSHHQGP